MVGDELGTADLARATSRNEADLGARRQAPRDGRRVTDVLMTTTTVRMLDGVHLDTTDDWPAVALRLGAVVGTTSRHERLVNATAARNDADHGAALGRDRLLRARRQLDARAVGVRVVTDNRRVVARRARQAAAVADHRLDVADDRTFRHQTDRHHVADRQRRCVATKTSERTKTIVLARRKQETPADTPQMRVYFDGNDTRPKTKRNASQNKATGNRHDDERRTTDNKILPRTARAAVQKLARGHALGRHERLGLRAVLVRVAELHLDERRTSARVVHDFFDRAADVAVALGVVNGAQLGGALSVVRARLENAALVSKVSASPPSC